MRFAATALQASIMACRAVKAVRASSSEPFRNSCITPVSRADPAGSTRATGFAASSAASRSVWNLECSKKVNCGVDPVS